MPTRLAIVLFNLGGPDGPDAVEPFLFNLFKDPAIIGAPGPVRWLLAKLISSRRAPVAREIYAQMGGSSPILGLTEAQAKALQAQFEGEAVEVETFIAMRYWHPFADETAAKVKAFAPDQIVLLPLYPQFSTTTTQSSFDDWKRAAEAVGLDAPTRSVCCYPAEPGWARAQAALLAEALDKLEGLPVRVLFSAHGLPKKIVDGKGDPYPGQVEAGARAILEVLGKDGLDWRISYQSRVGPLEWIGPSTDAEIEQAGRDGKALVVLPIAFVSEHSETLVELDIEYRHLAGSRGVAKYIRVPAVGTHPDFIEGLSDLVRGALASACEPSPQGGCERQCSAFSKACPARIS